MLAVELPTAMDVAVVMTFASTEKAVAFCVVIPACIPIGVIFAWLVALLTMIMMLFWKLLAVLLPTCISVVVMLTLAPTLAPIEKLPVPIVMDAGVIVAVAVELARTAVI